jgi:hypothetical protein
MKTSFDTVYLFRDYLILFNILFNIKKHVKSQQFFKWEKLNETEFRVNCKKVGMVMHMFDGIHINFKNWFLGAFKSNLNHC